MSYIEQTRRKNPASVAAVVGVHLAVGYALLTGLGYTVIPHPRTKTDIFTVPTEPLPPPPKPIDMKPTKQSTTVLPQPQPQQPDMLKADPIVRTATIDGPIGIPDGGIGPVEIAPPPPKPSLASEAVPARDRLRWITTDDYPTAALRQDIQGSVVISVMIGTDGRVRSCLVTQSSGSKLLDDATCRLYTARARFTPARDADGNPTAAQRTDRYRWQIPTE